MPTYEYTCRDCPSQTITITRAITDTPHAPICATCGHRMVRSYSAPTITFKGDGFYSTDKK